MMNKDDSKHGKSAVFDDEEDIQGLREAPYFDFRKYAIYDLFSFSFFIFHFLKLPSCSTLGERSLAITQQYKPLPLFIY